jgi:hypothetical protein
MSPPVEGKSIKERGNAENIAESESKPKPDPEAATLVEIAIEEARTVEGNAMRGRSRGKSEEKEKRFHAQRLRFSHSDLWSEKRRKGSEEKASPPGGS